MSFCSNCGEFVFSTGKHICPDWFEYDVIEPEYGVGKVRAHSFLDAAEKAVRLVDEGDCHWLCGEDVKIKLTKNNESKIFIVYVEPTVDYMAYEVD